MRCGREPWEGGAGWPGREHLLVVGLHAEEDEIGRGAGQAALQVGAAPNLLCFCVEAVEGLHSLLKELPLNLEGERVKERGSEIQTKSASLGCEQSPAEVGGMVGSHQGWGQHTGKTKRLQAPVEQKEHWTGSQESWGSDLVIN